MSPPVYDKANRRSPRALLAGAAATLAAAGVAAPRNDAELLLSHVLHVPRGRLSTVPDVTERQLAAFDRLVGERARRIPLQHLTGTAPFRHLEIAVGPGVFIPRPETELLVEWGLATLQGPAPTVVDLCSGSGAIALSVAVEAPTSRVYAVERAPAALRWLRRNVAALAPRVEVVEGDVTDPTTLSTVDGQVDLVLCNPPYVPDGVPVEREVRDHDPRDAVFGGTDGLDVIRGVVARVAALLRPGGWLGIEHDDSHGEAVPALLREHGGYVEVAARPDLAGRPRYAVARLL